MCGLDALTLATASTARRIATITPAATSSRNRHRTRTYSARSMSGAAWRLSCLRAADGLPEVDARRLGSIRDAELPVDRREVEFHRVDADAEQRGDLHVRASARDELEHLRLAWRETCAGSERGHGAIVGTPCVFAYGPGGQLSRARLSDWLVVDSGGAAERFAHSRRKLTQRL